MCLPRTDGRGFEKGTSAPRGVSMSTFHFVRAHRVLRIPCPEFTRSQTMPGHFGPCTNSSALEQCARSALTCVLGIVRTRGHCISERKGG